MFFPLATAIQGEHVAFLGFTFRAVIFHAAFQQNGIQAIFIPLHTQTNTNTHTYSHTDTDTHIKTCTDTDSHVETHTQVPTHLSFSVNRPFVFQSGKLESETGTTEEHSLNKEARKWATRVAREHKNIIHSQRVSSAPVLPAVGLLPAQHGHGVHRLEPQASESCFVP